MDNFKLRSIDEFDEDFIKFRVANSSEKDSREFEEIYPDTKYDDNSDDDGRFVPVFPEESDDFTSKSGYENVEVNPGAKRNASVLIAVKTFSIVLLVLTVILFVAGCFVSIFLDNDGASLGGICFNTLSEDVQQLDLSKGDLVVSKKVKITEYNPQDLICVKSDYGCAVHLVRAVPDNGSDIIETVAISDSGNSNISVRFDDICGKVKFYLPSLGNVLNFAMQNAILICVLFILLAALWCILLIVLEKKISEYKMINAE